MTEFSLCPSAAIAAQGGGESGRGVHKAKSPAAFIATLEPQERASFVSTPQGGREKTTRHCILAVGIAIASLALIPIVARAQFVTQPPKQPSPDEIGLAAPTRITVNARPIASFDLRDKSRVRFGSLQFRSGLILTSSFRGFGGLSSLRLDPKGEQFISASDKGTWFTGRIVYSGKEMTGLSNVEAAPMLGSDGKPITSRGWFDTESMALDGSLVYVGIERVNRIMRFDFGKGLTRARGEEVADVPAAIRKLPFNRGLEAMVVVPRDKPLGGTLIAISERGLDASKNLMAFLIGGPSPGQFAIRRTDNFDISDACLLPTGGLLILERKFSLSGGVGIRIRRIALKSIAPGALADGPSIFDADLGQEIDNFEGLDAHVDADGSTVLTLLSDDNFSMIQRTLLMQFTLIDD